MIHPEHTPEFTQNEAKEQSFDFVSISIASPEEIVAWTGEQFLDEVDEHGNRKVKGLKEVKSPETINYRSFKPEPNGLFCQRIFGPVRDYECYCGKYKKVKYKDVVCDKCGVEVTVSRVRRERMGYIRLAIPVSHIWFLKSMPSRLSLMLDMTTRQLEQVIYYQKYLVIDPGQTGLEEKQLLDEEAYRQAVELHGPDAFKARMGAEALQQLLRKMDLLATIGNLRDQLRSTRSKQIKKKIARRMKIIQGFQDSGKKPEHMVLTVLPVIPPDLRPLVPLEGGRFATSDLNDLYRRVINRNNRLKQLIQMKTPDVIIHNEMRMLQEAVDALLDNGRHGKPVKDRDRQLKSISDMLKGKHGRFRQNLLGKRVDYSGRSVIVVGPQLKLHQCGLPKQMALELFKPFVMKRLVDLNHAQNIKSAKRMVERSRPVVWDVLEEVISEHPVMLNRAPTLHRLGIQAFEPQLIEGKAIQIHPLVCTAFNADFDGDQMAVHLPLSAEAQAEARILMLSSNNILSPANGRPITTPTQDMVLGIYFMTTLNEGAKGEGQAYTSLGEAIMAFDAGALDLQARVTIRLTDGIPPADFQAPEGWAPGDPFRLETTLGRALFNEALPVDFPFVNAQVDKKVLGQTVNRLAEIYAKVDVAETLDQLKALGFHWATRSGVTISFSDVIAPPAKAALLASAEEKAEKVQTQYERGLITDAERRQELIEIWTRATDEVAKAMQDNFPRTNPVHMMVDSGARGNYMQVRQIAGMRGLVANPKGEIIPRPIKSNFREGLSVLEYFISTHGARKGLADTALRTADSGYLTRRLVDVSQDVIVREVDCGTDRGAVVPIADLVDGVLRPRDDLDTAVATRVLARDVEVDGTVVAQAGEELTTPRLEEMVRQGADSVRVRTVLTCESSVGTCAMCYGRSMATGKLVDVGEAIGIVAAQSIGEPGTQLTMRTFHTGGVAGEDITHGLPRVVELFEARTPKGNAPIAEVSGRARIEDSDKARKIIVVPDDGSEEIAHQVSKRAKLLIEDGAHVTVGEQLIAGAVDPKVVLRILGMRKVQEHLVEQVQEVYRSQGVSIHDKHIEVIVRQMLKRIIIVEAGDSGFLAGELVERSLFEAENRRVVAEGGQPASGRPELMGITKASLATESWLSAASFQETTRVLTDAAINAKSDPLLGLKENVILGKLIPAGTGMPVYRNVKVEPTEEAKAAMYASFGSYDDLDYSAFGATSGAAVPLEEFDYRGY